MTHGISCCSMLRTALDDPTIPMIYVAKFREIGINVLDGGDSYIVLSYCPWSGHKLPRSLREEWFIRLEEKGIDPTGSAIPDEFSDERWYADIARD